tara:strand:- start:278 stop:583 length:306 start_codon:yes stop_codon:yes gene_type:complete
MGTLSFTFGVIIIINFLFVISIFLVLNTMNLSRLKVEEKNNELEKEIITISQQINQVESQTHQRMNQVERDAVEYTNSQVGELKSKVYKDFDLIRNQGRQY